MGIKQLTLLVWGAFRIGYRAGAGVAVIPQLRELLSRYKIGSVRVVRWPTTDADAAPQASPPVSDTAAASPAMEQPYMGQELRRERERLGIDRTALARALGIKRVTLVSMETSAATPVPTRWWTVLKGLGFVMRTNSTRMESAFRGSEFKQAREKQGLTQTQAARKLGLHWRKVFSAEYRDAEVPVQWFTQIGATVST